MLRWRHHIRLRLRKPSLPNFIAEGAREKVSRQDLSFCTTMDASELARWTRFAAKGGIGKATAIQDCVAEGSEDLMFLQDDEIIVLMHLPEPENTYLGYCEGVVGRFNSEGVRFQGKLKKPVMTKRSSATAVASRSSLTQYASASPVPSLYAMSPAPVSPHPLSPAQVHLTTASPRNSAGALSSPDQAEVAAFRNLVRSASPPARLSTHSPPPTSAAPDSSYSLTVNSPSDDNAMLTPTMMHSSSSTLSTAQGEGPSTPQAGIEFPITVPTQALEAVATEPDQKVLTETENAIELAQEGQDVMLVDEVDVTPKGNEAIAANEPDMALPEIPRRILHNRNGSTASTASSVYSQRASRLSAQFMDMRRMSALARGNPASEEPQESAAAEESKERLSKGSDEDGGYGIGLSMLQNMVGNNRMSFASTDSESMYGDDPEEKNEDTRTPSPVATEEDRTQLGHSQPGLSVSTDRNLPPLTSSTNSSPVPSPVLSVASSSRSIPAPGTSRPGMSRSSTSLSISKSEASEDWDGMSIYDSYRYSRHSMASKASRYSFASINDGGRGGEVEEVPPLPASASFAAAQAEGRMNEGLQINAVKAQMTFPGENTMPLSPRSRNGPPDSPNLPKGLKGRPTPLDLQNNTISPLIHATFGSPASASFTDGTRHSSDASSSSFGSPPPQHLRSPLSPSGSMQGTASALRQRMEEERRMQGDSNMLTFTRQVPESKFAIVVEDDEVPNDGASGEGTVTSHSRARSVSVQESAGDAEQRFSQLTRDSQASAEGIPMRPVSAQREVLPKIQVENLHVAQAVFPSQPPNVGSPTSAMSPYLLSSLPPLSAGSSSTASPSSPLAPGPPSPGITVPEPVSTPTSPYFGNARTSMFMPHPNAPRLRPQKGAAAGPMYGRKSVVYGDDPAAQQARLPRLGSAVHAMHMAQKPVFYPNGARMLATIYGRCEVDLSASLGPVPMLFSLEPPNVMLARKTPPPSAAMSPPPLLSSQVPPRISTSSPKPQEGSASTPAEPQPQLKPTPQPNVFPAPSKPRPRSRSFSDVDKTSLASDASDSTRWDGQDSTGTRQSSPKPVPQRSSSTSFSSNTPKTTAPMRSVSARPVVARQSPLSLPQNNTVVALTDQNAGATTSQTSQLISKPGLRQVVSSIQLRGSTPRSPPLSPTVNRVRKGSDAQRSVASPTPSSSSYSPDLRSSSRISEDTENGDTSLTATPPLSIVRGSTSSGTPAHSRTPSIRSKLSMSAMRSDVNSDAVSPVTPTDEREVDVIQVKDMDFELVPPTGLGNSSIRGSMDSIRRGSVDTRGGVDPQRSTSPTIPSGLGRPNSPSIHENASIASRSMKGPEETVQVHRQLETKWLAILSATSPDQMRKSKKVKKILLDGVPSSLRSVIWANLANVKAHRMKDVYGKLSSRGKVAASGHIEHDLEQFFPNDERFKSATGPVATLLQAYLTMAPDIRYYSGLTLIAGYLLNQGPEEDAFWTFVSVMDLHLRGYFSPNPLLFEVDAALFSKAIEANDGALAKKLLVQLRLPPPVICKPWFTSIFARSLPTEYMVRVWDMFLFDGIPFLFRVGLAIASCCRRQLLETTDSNVALGLLAAPPLECLPDDVEAFITLAYSIKLKDEDILKQRVKMETTLRKQTQQQRPSRPTAGASITIRRA